MSSRGNDIMPKYEAVSALKEQSDAVRALGATSLYLFGSMVRDAATSTSDLDLFIEAFLRQKTEKDHKKPPPRGDDAK